MRLLLLLLRLLLLLEMLLHCGGDLHGAGVWWSLAGGMLNRGIVDGCAEFLGILVCGFRTVVHGLVGLRGGLALLRRRLLWLLIRGASGWCLTGIGRL